MNIMNSKDQKIFLSVVIAANVLGWPLVGIGTLLGDSTTGKTVLGIGLGIIMVGGFLILGMIALSGIAALRARQIPLLENKDTKTRISRYFREPFKVIREQISRVRADLTARRQVRSNPLQIAHGPLIFSQCKDGVSVSSIKADVRLPRFPDIALARLGDDVREYKTTVELHHQQQIEIDPPLLVRVNRERIQTSEVDFGWKDATQSHAHHVLLAPSKYNHSPSKSAPRTTASHSLMDSVHPVFYDLSGEFLTTYTSLISSVRTSLNGTCWYDREIWENIGIERWKGNSGSRYTVDRKNAVIKFKPGTNFQINREVVFVQLGASKYVIFPDCIVLNGRTVHPLDHIEVFEEKSDYVLSGTKVPNGSVVRGYTWDYVNKDGSPDLRYNDNNQHAIIDVNEVIIASRNRIIFSIVFSHVSASQSFAKALAKLSELNKAN
jgi:hypothetical protein